jgi:DNA mismatch repair protein MSH3
MVKYTPLEKQVLELKKQHSGMILMIQTAYKYTFFGEDAEVCFEYNFCGFNL